MGVIWDKSMYKEQQYSFLPMSYLRQMSEIFFLRGTYIWDSPTVHMQH